MVTNGTNGSPSQNTLVESNSYRSGSLAGTSSDLAAMPAVLAPSLLKIVWRSRWLLFLFTLVGALAGFLVILYSAPTYTGQARLLVEPVTPRIMGAALSEESAKQETFLYTQAEFIKSSPVLDKAVESIALSNPKVFQEMANPESTLKKMIDVTVGKKDNLLTVTIELPSANDAKLIINAVVNAYVAHFASMKRSTSEEVVKILIKEKDNRDKDVEHCRKAITTFYKENPTSIMDTEHGYMILGERCTQLSGQLTQAQLDLVQEKEHQSSLAEIRHDPIKRGKLLQAALAQGTIHIDDFLRQQIHVQELDLSMQIKKFDIGHPKVKELTEPLEQLRKREKDQQERDFESYLDGLERENELLISVAQQKVDKLQTDYRTELDDSIKSMANFSE